jgi:hypothetical protein
MIKHLVRLSKKKGIAPHKFSQWVHRIHGTLNVWRMRKDGILGCSLPCVLCRKAIENYKLKWSAFDGQTWIHSTRSKHLPKSKPTHKQRKKFKFV